MNPTTRCAHGDMARLIRNTTGCPMTADLLATGATIYCITLAHTDQGPVWCFKPRLAAGCWLVGLFDADLDPIKPPGVVESVERIELVGVEA